MRFIHKVQLFLFLFAGAVMFGQTPGFNYQALILNSESIRIPGTDILANQVPLGLEDITLRFTITNDAGIEYTEEQSVTTDENGMISLIVGEGTPITNNFEDIIWNGKIKILNVELDIHSSIDGFVFLDSQKILYLPQPNRLTNIEIVNTIGDLSPPYQKGDIIWLTEYGSNANPTLIIWDGANWVPVNNDFDPTNELGLITVANDAARDSQFLNPVVGDQAWNQDCKCTQVFDGSSWTSSRTAEALNGLYKDDTTIKLGGPLTEPTEITTTTTNTLAIKGLENSTNNEDNILVLDKNTGAIKQKSMSSITQQEQIIIVATDGQLEFSTPLNITSVDKIDVYRNGVRIDFTAVNTTTIKLEPEAQCYKNDKIRIVQLY